MYTVETSQFRILLLLLPGFDFRSGMLLSELCCLCVNVDAKIVVNLKKMCFVI